MVKFIHMADMHFDTAFKLLNTKSNLGQTRRMDQRFIFNNIIEKVKTEQANLLLIAGDLYEQKTIRESTIDYINSKFKEIPNTKVFIAPGNHDPFLKNSFYSTYNWAENVKIFGNTLEKIELPEVNIYGFGFTDYNSFVDLSVTLTHEKPNILLMHASLDGQDEYNPVPTTKIRNLGFDYVALGHIHKTNYHKNNNILYSGSPLAMGFDELGTHGVIEGAFTENGLNTRFINTDNREFIEKYVDISNMKSNEDLIERLNSFEIADNLICKVVLTGGKNFSVAPNILDFVQKNIVKIKENTFMQYNLENISKEKNLKGLFVKNLLEKLQDGNKEVISKALEIGLQLFE